MMGRGEENHRREGLQRPPAQGGHFPRPPAPGGQTSLASEACTDSVRMHRFSKEALDRRTCQRLQRTDTPLQLCPTREPRCLWKPCVKQQLDGRVSHGGLWGHPRRRPFLFSGLTLASPRTQPGSPAAPALFAPLGPSSGLAPALCVSGFSVLTMC